MAPKYCKLLYLMDFSAIRPRPGIPPQPAKTEARAGAARRPEAGSLAYPDAATAPPRGLRRPNGLALTVEFVRLGSGKRDKTLPSVADGSLHCVDNAGHFGSLIRPIEAASIKSWPASITKARDDRASVRLSQGLR